MNFPLAVSGQNGGTGGGFAVTAKLRSAFQRARSWLALTVTSVLTVMRHTPSNGGGGWSYLNRTELNYAGSVRADANSIVAACVDWAQRNFSEAPLILEEWSAGREDWDQHQRDPFLDLLERPNPYYDGDTMFRATIADLMVGDGGGGNAYWVKLRSGSGRPVELWWVPAHLMQPCDDPDNPTVFISHYEYTADGTTYRVRVDDVVHFRQGLDPNNPRKGMAPMKSLWREIFTDDEAANMTAVLLKNLGVPGVVIVPEHGQITKEAAEELKTAYLQKFSGDRRGEPLVMANKASIVQFGFSPEQMQMRSLRGIPEERITARLGINSAVLGLGAGLATTKVGATLKEYREDAIESFMVPLWKQLARTITHDLLGDFRDTDWRAAFNLAKVRALQDDENARVAALGQQLEAGGITVAEYRRALGMIVLPEHEVYLRRNTMVAVPAGLSPEDQAAVTTEATEAAAAVAAAERAVRR